MADKHLHDEEVLGKAYDSRLMRRLLTYLYPYKLQVIVALVAIVLKSGVDILGPYLTKVAVDKYLAHTAREHSFLDKWLSPEPLVGIGQVAGLFVAALLISFFLEFTQTYFMQWTGQKVMFDLRSQIFRHLQRMHIGFFDRNPVGRLVTRVTTDVDALNEMFTAGVVAIFEDVFVLAGILVIMLRMDWRLALITFAVLPVILVITLMFRKAVRDSYRRIRVAIARINAFLQEHVTGMVVVQLFNREKRAYDDFEKINRSHMVAFKDAIMAYALYYPAIEILSSAAIAGVIWFGGGQVVHGLTSLGVLVAFIQYAQRFFRPIQDLSEKYNILQSAMASSERIFKLLDTEIEIASPAHTQAPAGAGCIEFDHVWFAYNGRRAATPTSTGATESHEPDWVLRDVSFRINPGQTAAIVGHTGAGKTTLISLLLRFYDVQRGAIRIDGVDVRKMELGELRRRFGVVLQDPFLFSGTIKDNIRLGTDWIRDEEVERAAEQVNVGRFHPQSSRRVYRADAGARKHAFHRPETAHFLRSRPGARSQDPGARRGHLQRRHRDRIPGAGSAHPHGGGPHLGDHRPSPFDRATSGQHNRHAQRQAPRNGHAPGVARQTRPLLEALPASVQGPGIRRPCPHTSRGQHRRRR